MRNKKLQCVLTLFVSVLLISCSHGSSSSQASTTTQAPTDQSAGEAPKSQSADNSNAQPTNKAEQNPMQQVEKPVAAQSEKVSKIKAAAPEVKQTAPEEATPAPAPAPQEAPAVRPAATVTLSVVGDQARGGILPAQSISVKEGDTVLDILSRVMKDQKIQMEYSGAKSTAYVKGIDNLYEFDDGPKSGWMFKVNGKISDHSAGSFAAHPGDTIEWLYTVDLGKDIGGK